MNRVQPFPLARTGRRTALLLSAALLSVLLAISLLALWPTPASTLCGELCSALTQASVASLKRLAAGLLIGSLIGSVLGVLLGSYRWAEYLLGPLCHGLRQLPLFGWIGLLGLWAGYGEGGKITFVSLAVSFVMLVSTQQAVHSIAPRLIEVARSYQLPTLLRWRVLLLPSVLPAWLAGLRIALAVAWGATVGAEILVGNAALGLGAFIWGQRELGQVYPIVLGTVLIGAFGLLGDLALRALERRCQIWLGQA
ncbi:ABC transporter permease [Pseudomonas sp. 5P_3.1_Bac2]|uniref:ABC transporter permease n=1 Tax=Pseudomonas sp. 5P_3.1_Bac2 TaxID=2971617 RepID=UPI0021C6C613|nr:ABC transporter permease subunit [Pseudomonas sp. 5P_3.1_Bac2]MCU1718188.1 ABC transporter permease subunit [Pseudomonas sp. 5P_3.1_Bac2]